MMTGKWASALYGNQIGGVPHRPPSAKDFEKTMEMNKFESRIYILLHSCWTSRLYVVQKMVRLNSGRSAWAALCRGRILSVYQFPFPNNSTVGSFLVLSNLRLQNPKVVKMGYAWNYIPSILFSPWDEKGTPIPRNSALWIVTTHLLKH